MLILETCPEMWKWLHSNAVHSLLNCGRYFFSAQRFQKTGFKLFSYKWAISFVAGTSPIQEWGTLLYSGPKMIAKSRGAINSFRKSGNVICITELSFKLSDVKEPQESCLFISVKYEIEQQVIITEKKSQIQMNLWRNLFQLVLNFKGLINLKD